MAVPPPSLLGATAAKPEARRLLRAARARHVAGLAEAATMERALAAAAERVFAHVPAGARVALYHARGSEIDPAPLARRLTERGHPLALPHVAADGATMRFLAWHPANPLVPGIFGLSQPDVDGEDVAPTLILAPLLGFDRAGGRIGQGAGYYDRAFAALPGAIRIGYAWSAQEMDAVPRDPWDVPLHAIATEREWIVIPAKAA